jgi:hypothetical protein
VRGEKAIAAADVAAAFSSSQFTVATAVAAAADPGTNFLPAAPNFGSHMRPRKQNACRATVFIKSHFYPYQLYN